MIKKEQRSGLGWPKSTMIYNKSMMKKNVFITLILIEKHCQLSSRQVFQIIEIGKESIQYVKFSQNF